MARRTKNKAAMAIGVGLGLAIGIAFAFFGMDSRASKRGGKRGMGLAKVGRK